MQGVPAAIGQAVGQADSEVLTGGSAGWKSWSAFYII